MAIIQTSLADDGYNCIAWAAGDDQRWWWPIPENISYWPPNVPRDLEISTFIQAFEMIGYVTCSSEEYKDGYEKVAIFTKNGIPTHAAKQLTNGEWSSKLGQDIDISHNLSEVVSFAIAYGNTDYGELSVILKRKIDN